MFFRNVAFLLLFCCFFVAFLRAKISKAVNREENNYRMCHYFGNRLRKS